MALSRREQRALREIEELLTADDPALAGLLSRAGAARWETIRRVTRAVVAVAMPLLLFGLLLGDMSFVGGGLLMLALFLLARWQGRRAEGAE